jgi:hypothetical protein
VGFVFDPPVLANGVRREVRVDGAVGQVERGFDGGLPTSGRGLEDMDQTLYLNDGGDIRRPLRAGDRRGGIEHGNGSGFVAVAIFSINGPNAGERLGGGASGLYRLTQGQLVVLELYDQMGVRGGGGLEGFFDSASRRR